MEIDLRRYVRLLFKRKWYVVAALVVGTLIGVVITVTTAPVYHSQATLFVGERQVVAGQDVFQAVQQSRLTTGLMKSYAQIIRSRSTARKAIEEEGLNLTPGQVVRGLQAQALPDTQVLAVSFTGNDPALAAQVANAVSKAFSSEIQRLESSEPGAQPVVQVSVIDAAVAPSSPIFPNPQRNVTLAAVLGLIGGVGLAFLVDHLDVSIKNREDVEQMGASVLGSIPALDTEGEDVHLERDTQGLGGEAFRKLRTSIGFLGVESPVKSILLTSPFSQEGKSTIALNLASAYALGGFRTLLIEADLRRPSLHKVFGMRGTNGLTTVIVGGVPLDDAIFHTETRNLSVLLAGAIPPNPVELLASEQMADLLKRLKIMFDVLIVDSPPVVPVADPAALSGMCDGTVIVCRAGKTDGRRLADALQVVERAGGRMLGVALNFLSPGDSPYDYEYYYYGYRAAGDKVASLEKSRGR